MTISIDTGATRPNDSDEWYADARKLLDHLGFVAYRNGFFQHAHAGVYAFIDSHEVTAGARYFGLFQLRLNLQCQEMMHPVALIPWYGDGEDRRTASALAYAVAIAWLDGGLA